MADRDTSKPRDPVAKKAKDLSRQRKIATNSSTKASRKNAPRIKAMANRRIRRADKIALDPDYEDSADQIKLEHQRKAQHWGSDNAAEHRKRRAETLAHYQEIGGRNEAQSRQCKEMLDQIDNAAVVKLLNETIDRLAAKKAKKS